MAFDCSTNGTGDPWLGDSMSSRHWEYDHSLFTQIANEVGPNWPLIRGGAFGGDDERARTAVEALAAWRKANYRGW